MNLDSFLYEKLGNKIEQIKSIVTTLEKNRYEINVYTQEEIDLELKAKQRLQKIFNNTFTKEELNKLIILLFDENKSNLLTKTEKENLGLLLLDIDVKFLFNGKLTDSELAILKSKLNDKKIKTLEEYLEKHQNNLNGYIDLVGDTLIPDEKLFFFMLKHFGNLIDDDYTISKNQVRFRQAIHPILKKIGANFLKHPHIIENREFLNDSVSKKHLQFVQDNINLPNEPVIWALNHGFKDDGLATILACPRHAYIVFGNIAQLYNTFDGITSILNGVVPVNRKVSLSRKTLNKRVGNVFKYSSDIVIAPEGIWCKSMNRPVLDPWSGVWNLACEYGKLVVPMIHYVEDPNTPNSVIHTVIDEPIKIDDLSLESATNLLKDIWSEWLIKIMQVYVHRKREQELEGFNSIYEKWEDYLRKSVALVERYDSMAEHYADLRLGTQIEDVFNSIANIQTDNALTRSLKKEARNILAQQQLNDFQRRI